MSKIKKDPAYTKMFAEYPEVLTVKDVCKMLGFKEKKVYQLINDGTIPRIPCGRAVRVAKASVIKLVLQSAQ